MLPFGVLLSMLSLSSSSLVQVILLFKSRLVGNWAASLVTCTHDSFPIQEDSLVLDSVQGDLGYLIWVEQQLRGGPKITADQWECTWLSYVVGWNPSVSRYPNYCNEVYLPTQFNTVWHSLVSCESLGSQRLQRESDFTVSFWKF